MGRIKKRTNSEFISDDREIDLIQQFDWSQTPLGSAKTWSESFKTEVSAMLSSQITRASEIEKKPKDFEGSKEIHRTKKSLLSDLVNKIQDPNNPSENFNWQLNNVFMQAPVAICIFQGHTFIVDLANKYMLELWDRTAEQVMHKCVFEGMPDLKNQGFEELLDKVYTTGQRFVTAETPLTLLRNGKLETVYIKLIYEALRKEDGTIYAIMAMADEITELVLAKKKAEESDAFNKTVLESSPDCVKILDTEGQLQFMNHNGQCIMEIDDFTPFKNKYWWDLWGDENKQRVKDVVAKAIEGETGHFQVLSPTMKGTPKWWDVLVSPVLETSNKNVSKIISVSRDITNQKLASIKLEESEKSYYTTLMQSPFAFSVMKGDEMVITLANDLMKDFWGKGKDVENKPLLEVLPEVKDQPFFEMIQRAYTTGAPVYANETLAQLEHKGKIEDRYFNIVYQPHYETDGTISGVITIAHEVTPQAINHKKMEAQATMVYNLLMTAPGFVATLSGPTHIYELVNEQYQSLFGKRKIKGMPMMVALPELEGQGIDKILDQVYTTGEPYVSINIPITIDGDEHLAPELRYFNFSYQPMYDENRIIYSILVFGHEVTEQMNARKKVEESEAKYRQMSELMPEKITNADEHGRVFFYNQSWMDYTGASFKELTEEGLEKWIHPDDSEEASKRLQKSIKTGNNYEMELRIKNYQGDYNWHLFRSKAVKDHDGKIQLWIGVNTEIQKIKAEEIRKEGFLKMVSHELKTPISSIKGYVQLLLRLLKDEHEKLLSPLPLRAFLVRVEAQTTRLTRLISEFLDLSRLNEGKLELQETKFNLNELVKDTVEDIRFTNLKYHINIDHEMNAWVCGDKDRIGQVIINFITNGIKYSPTKDIIEVRIYQKEKNKVIVSVKDYGIGIDKKDQQKIFERFYRVEGKNESTFAGFGIGLFIAKEIIERHDGSITIESEKEEGSTFSFILPCEEH